MAELETWEMQTGGQVWVEVTLDKVRGTTRHRKVHGKGALLRISTEDRQMAQERIRVQKHDPFTNGMLILTKGTEEAKEETKSESSKSDDALMDIFKLRAQAKFRAALEDLSEIAIRRLAALAAESGDTVTASQQAIVKETIQAKFSVNKDKTPIEGGPEKIAETFPVQKLGSA